MIPQIRQLKHLSELCHNLSHSLKLGLSLSQTLTLLNKTGSKARRRHITQLTEHIQKGYGLPYSLYQLAPEFCPIMFDPHQSANKTDRFLSHLETYYTDKYTSLKAIINKCQYPLFLGAMTLLSTLFMLIVLVPNYKQLYTDMGISPPAFMTLITTVTRSVTTHLYLSIGGSLLIGWTGIILYKTQLKPWLYSLIFPTTMSDILWLLDLQLTTGLSLKTALNNLNFPNHFPLYKELTALKEACHETGDFQTSFCKTFNPSPAIQDIIESIPTGSPIKTTINTLHPLIQKEMKDQLDTQLNRIPPYLLLLLTLGLGGLIYILFIPLLSSTSLLLPVDN